MAIVKNVTLQNGRTITMELTEDWDEITFSENGNELEGEFKFKKDNDDLRRFQLTRMYSPIPRSGLGEHAIRFFLAETNNPSIWTHPDDGIPLGDQSHLTEKAPPFVKKMQKLGLIEPWYSMGEHLDYWEY